MLPVFLHVIVHADTSHLIKAHKHSLPCRPEIAVVAHKVFGDRPKTRFRCQKMHFLFEFVHDLLRLVRVQICLFDRVENPVRDIRILDLLNLVATVLIIKRNRRVVLHCALEVIDRNIPAERPRCDLIR